MNINNLKCKKCAYTFSYEAREMIQCPYCKEEGPLDAFELLNYEITKDGYARTLSEFQSLLEQGEKEILNSFFNEEVKDFTLEYEDSPCFIDKNKKKVSIERVHKYIQKDLILQRKLYNVWMDFYR